MHNLAVIIPALNESLSIKKVVTDAAVYGQPFVIDDGSKDDTGLIAKINGAFVIVHPFNLGYDAALESGLIEAQKQGYLYAITLDADGQLDPSLLATFVSHLRDGIPLVVGMRDKLQRPAEHIFAWLSQKIWNLADPLCGIKGYRLECLYSLNKSRSLKSVGTELAIRLIRSGHPFIQIPVKTRPRVGSSRFGDGWKINLVILGAMIRVFFLAKKL